MHLRRQQGKSKLLKKIKRECSNNNVLQQRQQRQRALHRRLQHVLLLQQRLGNQQVRRLRHQRRHALRPQLPPQLVRTAEALNQEGKIDLFYKILGLYSNECSLYWAVSVIYL